MADALEPNRLSRALNRPLWSPRITDTPLRDLVRGRLTGRLDWRGAIRAAALPPHVADAIVDVARRTKLWRIEKAAVAQELIAHFADGLASGASADDLLRGFGDARAAANLIRRAKRRNRPLAWHALKWTRRVLLALVLLYAFVFARFALTRPTVSVDYVALLNAQTLAAPTSDRAWPIYRRAMLALGLNDWQITNATITRSIYPEPGDTRAACVVDSVPADAAWPELTAWLDAHADGIALIREAAGRPTLGFLYGPAGSQVDAELGWSFADSKLKWPFADSSTASIEHSLMTVLLPYLNEARVMGKILAADARLARSRGDAARAVGDVDAMIGLARQLRGPTLVDQQVGIGIAWLAFDDVEAALASDGRGLDDAALVALAHRAATYGGDAPGSLVDVQNVRAMFRDVVQRFYSDDGHGDGLLTIDGVRFAGFVRAVSGPVLAKPRDDAPPTFVAATALLCSVPAVTSRRAVVEEFDRLLDASADQLARPRREWADDGATVDRLREINASPLLLARYLPVTTLLPAIEPVADQTERALGRREGVTVGLALELYRRRHGDYPSTLDALAPALLPRVPVDRITGGRLKYRLIGGRPVVYSVGVDRDDDGARAANVPHVGAAPQAAAVWGQPTGTPVDGDWILYDGRPAKAD